MPLKDGYSKATIAHNIRAELQAGRERDQALALALSKSREAQRRRKMWLGGEASEEEKPYTEITEQPPEREDTTGVPHLNDSFEETIVRTMRGDQDKAPSPVQYDYQLSNPYPAEDEEETDDIMEMARRLKKKKRPY